MYATQRGRRNSLPARFLAGAVVVGLGVGLHALPTLAVELEAGGLQGSLDTTISHGLSFRVGDRDENLIGINSDDGDRNYDQGLISNTSRFVSELDLEAGNFGAFVRVQGFIDFENRDGDGDYKPLAEKARAQIGDDLELLDAYVAGAFDAGAVPIDARVGNQVLNWGESTFIPNGISVINPFDVTKFRKPGAELRDGLLPVPAISGSVGATDALTVEGFYQLAWEETEIDPAGTYFSTIDYVGAGGSRAFLDSDEFPDAFKPRDIGMGGGFGPLSAAINADLASAATSNCQITGLSPAGPTFAGSGCQPAFDANYLSVARGPDRDPRDSGQWGVAFRYFAEELNATEFGFYFINHHSRLPLVSATYPTPVDYNNALLAASAVTAPGSATASAVTSAVVSEATPVVTQLVTEAVTQEITNLVAAGIPLQTPDRDALIEQQVVAQLASPAVMQQIADTIEAQLAAVVADEVPGQVSGVASILAIDRYRNSARYNVEYPEDLQVFGFSFNTQLGTSGWALQGEYSFHPDTPLQRQEASLFTEGLRPLTDTLEAAALANKAALGTITPAEAARLGALNAGLPEQLARLGGGLQGWVARNVSQIQATATRVFGPTFGADSLAFVTEAALTHVHGMPDQGAMPLKTAGAGDDIADATSWGYRMAARLDYNNAIGAARLSPYAQFQHDVSGSSPAPGGPFVQGRAAMTLGLGASYLDRLRADLSVTLYEGSSNYLSDRDFVSLSVSYSF